MKYSFVIPCYKSQASIEHVISSITKLMDHKNLNYEIICINDYPNEDAFNHMKQLTKSYPNLIIINLSKNFGQHSALMAGYNHITGDIIISLDDDGQTDPNSIFKLIDKLNEGYDVVFAKYINKEHSTFRNLGSKINSYMAYKLINKPKKLFLSSYFITKRYIIDQIILYKHCYPYISGLLLRTTSYITNVEITHLKRTHGESNYSISKLFKLWLNGFTSFSIIPLRLSMIIGALVALIGFMLTLYTLINYFINTNVPIGWSSTIAATSFIGGMILMVLGMIGEYIGRIFMVINNSPQYIIKEIYNDKK